MEIKYNTRQYTPATEDLVMGFSTPDTEFLLPIRAELRNCSGVDSRGLRLGALEPWEDI